MERSIPFYRALFGVEPAKVRDGYAKFEVAEPALNFTLNEGRRDGLGALDHAGIQVESTEDVLRAKARFVAAGLTTFDEMDTTCCYAEQDKIWGDRPRRRVLGGLRDPRGLRGGGLDRGPAAPGASAAMRPPPRA